MTSVERHKGLGGCGLCSCSYRADARIDGGLQVKQTAGTSCDLHFTWLLHPECTLMGKVPQREEDLFSLEVKKYPSRFTFRERSSAKQTFMISVGLNFVFHHSLLSHISVFLYLFIIRLIFQFLIMSEVDV